jgi:hypothetical protein
MGISKKIQLEEMDRNSKKEERLSESIAKDDDVGFKDRKWSEKFQTIALFKDDIKLLKKLADKEQRSMARQLSVIIQKAVAEQKAA